MINGGQPSVATNSAHALLVGIDGVRYDILRDVDTPAIDSIATQGFLQPVPLHAEVPSISGPSWATMVTGVLPTAHHILDNDLRDNTLAANPDVIYSARVQHPGTQYFIGADWQPLVTAHSGGPVFRDGGFVPDCRRGAESEQHDWHRADQLVTDAAATFLHELDSTPGSASFVYLHGCDTAGHRTGVSDLYREFIRESDRRVGELLRTIDARPDRATEDWLIVVATDHGHRSEGGHGGESPEERTAWVAACGRDVPAGLSQRPMELADVAGHAFHVLDLKPWSSDFIGVPFGTRTAQPA